MQTARNYAAFVQLRANGLVFPTLSAGPPDGPVVLCLHGFPDRPETFRHLLPKLAAAGFRAVAPTMRGYAMSCVHDDVSLPAIATDIVAWLDALSVERAHVVGHDWGAIAAHVAALHSDRVDRIVSLAIPPLGHPPRASLVQLLPGVRRSWYMGFAQTSLAERQLPRLVRKLWRDWSPGYDGPDVDDVLRRLDPRPVRRAVLGYYRALPAAFRLLRTPHDRPVLVLLGTDDGCLDPRLVDHLDVPADVDVVRIGAAGHFLQLERPDVVDARILDFLTR